MERFRCPTHSRFVGDLIGCGASFDAEPDHEGLVDCPECGIWFPADEGRVKLRPFIPGARGIGAGAKIAAGPTIDVSPPRFA